MKIDGELLRQYYKYKSDKKENEKIIKNKEKEFSKQLEEKYSDEYIKKFKKIHSCLDEDILCMLMLYIFVAAISISGLFSTKYDKGDNMYYIIIITIILIMILLSVYKLFLRIKIKKEFKILNINIEEK